MNERVSDNLVRYLFK
jgi:serine/threonine protein kinase